MCLSREDAACYRLYAANCLELAEHSGDADRKLFLLRIAQGWVNLADQVERQDAAQKPAQEAARDAALEPPPGCEQEQDLA
jgi:hypothetical protein